MLGTLYVLFPFSSTTTLCNKCDNLLSFDEEMGEVTYLVQRPKALQNMVDLITQKQYPVHFKLYKCITIMVEIYEASHIPNVIRQVGV